jgi:basic membrane protein A
MPRAQVDELVGQKMVAELRRLADEGTGLIIVDGMVIDDVIPIAAEYPTVRFAIGAGFHSGSLPSNVAVLTHVDSEPSYLAGAAAALTSETGTIGYIGGVDWEGIWGFQAGYEAGARAVDPDIEILAAYLSTADFSGFDDIEGARQTALAMYADGADVILHAAGTSGLGLFEAATAYTRDENRHVWAIGVDSDQWDTVMRLPGASDADAWRAHILTSVLKPVEEGAYAVVAEYAEGTFRPGPWNWGLESGASGLSFSGGYIDDLRPTLEELEAKIIAGDIEVPCFPASRLNAASDLGLDPDSCHD